MSVSRRGNRNNRRESLLLALPRGRGYTFLIEHLTVSFTVVGEGRALDVTTFAKRLAQLKSDLVAQGDRVVEMTLRAVESWFELDREKADAVIRADDLIDRVDIEIERGSIPLLAMGQSEEYEIRSVLMLVKINNELERIADCAVNIAEIVVEPFERTIEVPATFRVMANSVIGILRDANRSLARLDTSLASQTLSCDDTVDRFKRSILLDAQEQVAAGSLSVQAAFRLMTVTKSLERIADHCTNICEQVIYLESGLIVRHRPEGWTAPVAPDAT